MVLTFISFEMLKRTANLEPEMLQGPTNVAVSLNHNLVPLSQEYCHCLLVISQWASCQPSFTAEMNIMACRCVKITPGSVNGVDHKIPRKTVPPTNPKKPTKTNNWFICPVRFVVRESTYGKTLGTWRFCPVTFVSFWHFSLWLWKLWCVDFNWSPVQKGSDGWKGERRAYWRRYITQISSFDQERRDWCCCLECWTLRN